MSQNTVWDIRSRAIAKIEKSRLSMERCLMLLDGGTRNVFLMEKGRFSGYAINGEACRKGFSVRNGNASWEPQPVPVAAILSRTFEDLSKEEQVTELQGLIAMYPTQEEFPLLDESMDIVSVIGKKQEQMQIDWHKAAFPEEILPYGKFYLSSLGSENLLGFYLRYQKEVPMEVLSQENLSEAFLGAGVLVYEKDFFPEGKKECLPEAVKHQALLEAARQEKAAEAERQKQAEEEKARKQVEEEARRAKEAEEEQKKAAEIEKHLPIVRIAKEWASLKEDQLADASRLVEQFDKGYYSVSILDAKGKFQSLVCRHEFRKDFPGKGYKFHPELYVEFEEDEEILKRKLARRFIGTDLREIPILKDGKIVALGRHSVYFDSMGRWDSRQVLNLDWKEQC